jgi:molybdate/tungstate transport system ATP-binding protein
MFDSPITHKTPEERGVGFVYQNYMLFSHLNVFDNVAFGLKLKKLTALEIRSRVKSIAKVIGISKLLSRNISTLSGGEQQRVALARALILKPKILLLDEPLSALDPNIQDKIKEEIKKIHNAFKITIIHVTHNREEAVVLGDRIGVMENGKILQVGKTDEIFRKPTSRFVAEFTGAQNIFTGRINRNGVVEINGLSGGVMYTTSPLTGKVNVSIRPEDILISNEKVKTSARNVIRGKIISMEDKGAMLSITVSAGQTFRVYITRQALEELGIELGSEVYILFKASALHVF